MNVDLTRTQQELVRRPLDETLFLEGPAGAGKTTAAIFRLRHLLTSGVPADEILILAPQRTLLTPYQLALRNADLPPGGWVDTLTVGGLARRMVDLFWPLLAERAGFGHPDRPPTFLTLETAQYYMARVADPFVEAEAFAGVTIDRNRLLSQILDNLNKAALVGLDHTQVGQRLKSAWSGANVQATVYEQAQQCANQFRAYCLAHNLLDFSLQLEVFIKHLLTLPWFGENFLARFTRYRHLIVDNLEEDTPATHDLLEQWLPICRSAWLIYDHDAGYRLFLGADPDGALRLRPLCQRRAEASDSLVMTPDLGRLGYELARSLRQTPQPLPADEGDLQRALVVSEAPLRFHPQMLDWVAETIADLVHGRATPPGEIVVLAPYLSDALRFSLMHRLDVHAVPVRSHRPSRALRDEPVARCLLNLAALGHPEWGRLPLQADMAQSLSLALGDLDLVRGQLLTEIVYRPAKPKEDTLPLSPFADIKTEVQERIGYQTGNRYERLRQWLAQAGGQPLDHFFSRLFGELLSQPGYGLQGDYDAGRVTAQLIESSRKFRQVVDSPRPSAAQQTGQVSETERDDDAKDVTAIGLEYVRMVERGVIAAQYVPAWREPGEEEDAVLLAPAYTFLMRNRPVDYQFWLNAGSLGWWQRLYQPLTHPYVLTRHWPEGQVWTDADEHQAQTQALHRLVQGLTRRCRRQIYLAFSDLGERGYEQRGPLLQAVQGALRRARRRGA